MVASALCKAFFQLNRPKVPIVICNAFLSTQTPPKRPMGSFFLFVMDENRQVGISRKEFVKQSAEKWKLLSDWEKQPYADKQKESLERYKLEKDAFLESLSDYELDQVKHEKAMRSNERFKRRQKKLKKSLGIPKQPRNAYILFVQSQMPNSNARTLSQHTERVKSIAADWRNLSENKKQVFYDKAAQDKERYKVELEDYVSNLRDSGHEELIPKNYILQLRRVEKKKEQTQNLQKLIDESTEKLRNL